MIRIQIDSEDESSWSNNRMVAARQSLELLGERVSLTYVEKFTPIQKAILFVMFVSGLAFGTMLTLILYNIV